MTTLDHFTLRPARRVGARALAMAFTVLVLLSLGAVALTAPSAPVSDDWHGNVAAAGPR